MTAIQSYWACFVSDPIKLHCPSCGRFLVEATDYARLPCPRCGAQVTWESKQARPQPRTAHMPWGQPVELRAAATTG